MYSESFRMMVYPFLKLCLSYIIRLQPRSDHSDLGWVNGKFKRLQCFHSFTNFPLYLTNVVSSESDSVFLLLADGNRLIVDMFLGKRFLLSAIYSYFFKIQIIFSFYVNITSMRISF
jgi:hypothetical protein